jgi:hypothetical protein
VYEARHEHAAIAVALYERVDGITVRRNRGFDHTAVFVARLRRRDNGFRTACESPIVDTSGHTRVKIDETGFQVYDAAGHRRILLGMDKFNKPALFFANEAGYSPLQAYISPKNTPVVMIGDEKGNGRAYFGLTTDQHQPRIEFDDSQANQRLYVGLTKESTGIVRTYTASGANQTSLEDDKVWITDGNGNNRIYLGTSSDGDGILRMYDASTRERIYAGVFTDQTSGFQSLDSAGSVTWSSGSR